MTSGHPDILIVGNPEECHIGAHFQLAARTLGQQVCFMDVRTAYTGSPWAQALLWRCGRRPLQLARFSREILSACQVYKPTYLLTTGLAPVRSADLEDIGRCGIVRLNFLTDDPWNSMQYAGWFQKSLLQYDHIFSPRRGNLKDLRGHGCNRVHYLPFAYSPAVHFPEIDSCNLIDVPDVIFAGGADTDRLPYVRALISGGLKVALFGGYWDRHADLKPYSHGNASLATLRHITSAAKIALCLVRRANRDGHAMRRFEVPAMGGCMLIEDTIEHREIFGKDGETASYFRSIPEMVNRARLLVENEAERNRLASAAHARITRGRNAYADRLEAMLEITSLNRTSVLISR